MTTRTIHGEELSREERSLLRFVWGAHYGSILPKGMDWDWAEGMFGRFERRNLIYYTRVDGEKCYRYLTAHGSKILDDIKRVGDFDY